MALDTLYFDIEGEANTAKTVRTALAAAKELNIRNIVVATTNGSTARCFIGKKEVSVVAVTHAYGFKEKGQNSVTDAVRAELIEEGIRVHTSAHVLSGAERGLSTRFGGINPVEIIAATLRFFGQGTKVAVEVAVSALDAGLIPYGEPVIAVGGTRGGADTAVVLIPAYSSNILDTRILRFLAKPLNPSVPEVKK
jgi:uncharacterized protein